MRTVDRAAREMAYSLAAPLYIGVYSVWNNADDDEANERWHHETLKSFEPITRCHYMGETDLLASPTRAAESLAPGVWNGSRRFDSGMIPTGRFTATLARRETRIQST